MYNDLFSIGPVTVHTYGVMTAVGIICAYFIAMHRMKKRQMSQESMDRIFGLAIFMIVFGYLCSKLLYILTIIPHLADGSMTLAGAVTGGWVIYGGLLGGLLGGILYCRWKKAEFWEYMDVAVPAVAFAQGCGRIGCFFAGCCYGLETDSSWFYLEFTHSAFAPNHVHLIPTELIMSAGDFLLFFFLLFYEKKLQKKEGELIGMYLMLYSIGRFLVEFLRGDSIRGQIGVLSTSQFIGIFAAAAGAIILINRRKYGRNLEEVRALHEAEKEKAEADQSVVSVKTDGTGDGE
ncbi:MAG: prolipoprotein diacylglyceryl transferase [Eubacteriales bacterium]|jgi:phosphatidylglycerol:prolipoprotein diacylglycerol transferase